MAESPVIPKLLAQDYPRPQPSAPTLSTSKGSELDRLKSRVPSGTDSPLVPVPLFSSAKQVVKVGNAPPVGQTAATLKATGSSMATIVTTMVNPTPDSPSPSQFPLPPHQGDMVASPVDMVSPVSSVQAPTSIPPSYQQAANSDNARNAELARPASSIYSEFTMSTMAAASSPRTPTMTNWASVLPGIPSPDPNAAGMHTSTGLDSEKSVSLETGPVVEEQLAPQHIQVQIQVPRLRSPSLPQDRSNRRRTVSNAASVSANGLGAGSVSSLPPAVCHPQPTSAPEPAIDRIAMDYEGSDWPLRRPSVVHNNMSYKQYVHRSHGSDSTKYDPYHSHGHVANKESVSSTNTFGHFNPHDSYIASLRVSVADSHTPIHGPREQRSGWWYSDDDDDDVEHARIGGGTGYAAVRIKEAEGQMDAQRRRSRKFKIIVGASVLVVILIGVGVALGVVLSSNRGNGDK